MRHHVVVTGGYGFIGIAITDFFNNAGYNVTVISRNLDAGSNKKIYNFIKADIGNEDSINKAVQEIKNCDILVHTAASLRQDISAITTNVYGSLNVFYAALKLHCQKVVYISSVPIIGKPEVIPVDENHPVKPETLYHLTKYTGEQILSLPDFRDLDGIILRIPAPIGPQMPFNKIVPVIIDTCLKNNPVKLFGKGSRVQNYIDTRDIAHSVLLAAEYLDNKSCKGEVFLVPGHSVSNFELANTCMHILRSSSQVIFDGRPDPEEEYKWIINGRKAKKTFGFEPEISLEESILAIAQEIKNKV